MGRSYEEIIVSAIGDFGRFQLFILFAAKVLLLPIIASAMLIMSFAGAPTDWWKVTSYYNETSNTTQLQRFYKQCPENGNETIVFDDRVYTIVSEWSLVCGRKWIPGMITTIQMVGALVGAALFGQTGDWFGRKKSLVISYAGVLVFMVIEGFSLNWYMMTVCAFFLGISIGGILVISTPYYMEFVGTKWRTVVATTPAWAFGVILLGGLFKLLQNWRHLCYTCAALGFPVLLLFWFCPESVRWLFVHGDREKAKKVLEKMAKINGRSCPDLSGIDEVIRNDTERKNRNIKYSYIKLLKRKSTRWKIIPFAFIWFTMSFGYYATTFGVNKLQGDMSINMMIMGALEAFAAFMVLPFSMCFGRKYTTIIFLILISSSSFGVTIAFSTNTTNFNIILNILAQICRFSISAAWISVIVYTLEMFPTCVRGAAFGVANVSCRIGNILAPQTASLSDISFHLPFTVNGSLSLICAFICLYFKDTYQLSLEDEYDDKNDSKDLIPLSGDLLDSPSKDESSNSSSLP